MTTPKLALIPSAYKESKVYSPLPINGDGDFTFTRTTEATRVNKDGLIETVGNNIPRLDYLDGSCPSLLLEPSRTNLITYSSEVNEGNITDFTSGTGLPPDLLSETDLAPDGSFTACEWRFNVGSGITTSDISTINNNYYTDGNVDYTMSVYLYAELDNTQIYIRAAGSNYTLKTLNAGWNRVQVTDTSTSTSSSWSIGLIQGLSGGTINSNVTVKVWGLQVEEGSDVTSYIPTNGSIVTRAVDVCTLDTTNLDLSSITETFTDNSTNVITVIPSTYSVSEGKIAKIIGE